MTTSAKYQGRPDVLGDEAAPRDRRRSRALTRLAACAVAGAVAGASLVWVSQDGGATAPDRGPVSMSGAMTVGGYGSIGVDRGSRYQEERSARGNGTIELYLPDRDLAGRVTMEFSASLLQPPGSDVPDVVHSWGTAIAAFGATTCRGSTALSHFRRYPEEGSGTLQLLCDDRSAFAADVAVTRMGDSVDFELRDGWYVPAGRA